MSCLNSVIVEGDFQHFTSKRGLFPISFILNCDEEPLSIFVPDDKVCKKIISQKPKRMRIIGKLKKYGHNTYIVAEHIDFRVHF